MADDKSIDLACNGSIVSIIKALNDAFTSIYKLNPFLGGFIIVALFAVIFYFLYCLNTNKKAFASVVSSLAKKSTSREREK